MRFNLVNFVVAAFFAKRHNICWTYRPAREKADAAMSGVECLEDRALLSFQALQAPTALSAAPNGAVSFDVNYQTQNESGTPTVLPSNGMTVRTFFSSAKLTYQSTTNTLQSDLFADTSMADDTDNLDGDASTDKYLNVTWFSANSAFPTVTQPVKLFTANFTAASNFSGSTTVKFGGLPGANFQLKTTPLVITATAPQLPAQVLTPSNTNISVPANAAFSFDVNYKTLNSSGTPTVLPSNGLTVSTFFDSSKLTFQQPTNTLQESLFSSASVQDDVDDLDGNAATDKYFNIVWFSSGSNFPTSTQPVRLFTANFTAASNFIGSTTIDFDGHPGANFKLQSTPVTVSATAPADPTQLLTTSSTNISAPAGSAFNFDVNYKTLNGNGVPAVLPSNGLTVSTFFDSSKMTFQAPTNTLQDGLFSAASVQDDTDDLDGNAATDKYFNIVWFSSGSTFPTGPQPVRLFTANFTAANNFSGSTTVGFGGQAGANFKIQSTPVTVTASGSLQLSVGGPVVTWIHKQPPVIVLPQVTVGGRSSLAGQTLTVSVTAVGTSKKLFDLFSIPSFNSLGLSSGLQFVDSHLSFQIQLGEGATSAGVQSFLRGISFSTKGKGLKIPTRTLSVSLASNGVSHSISQTIDVRKKA